MNVERRSYRARWLFPVDSEPIENGTVEIEDGRITAVHAARDPRAEDLGNVAVIPGLVNAHTHLEFSDLRDVIKPRPSVAPRTATTGRGFIGEGEAAPTSAVPFADWIRAVVDRRQARPSDPWPVIAQGLQESAHTGCTTLGEIATTDWPADPSLSSVGPRLVVFRELIGPLSEHIEPQLQIARRHLTGEENQEPDAGVGCVKSARTHLPQSGASAPSLDAPYDSGFSLRGLSPHAPYSVHLDLFHKLVELAAEFRAPLAIHLAETQAELELLNHGSGELVRLREEFGIWRDDAVPRGTRPLDYLRPLTDLDRALIIHGNYLSEKELDFVARHPNLAVVYCPRTHAHFGHREHPWRELLERGASVAIGTDSRASNPDLSLWRELCFLTARYPGVDPRTLLKLGTLCGARALGLDHETASLTAGKSADLAVVFLASSQQTDPFSRLFDRRHRVIGTMRAGRWLHRHPERSEESQR